MVRAGTQRAGLQKTTDGGTTWTRADVGITFPGLDTIGTVALDPGDPTTLFATAGGHLFKSSDAGASWDPAGSGIASGDYVRAVAVDPTASSVVYAGVMVFFPFDQLIRRNQPGLFTAKSGTN